jgi:hypothetical protein
LNNNSQYFHPETINSCSKTLLSRLIDGLIIGEIIFKACTRTAGDLT